MPQRRKSPAPSEVSSVPHPQRSGQLKTPWHTGTVLRGDQYGRTLGFPTANLDPFILARVKKDGVYACQLHLGSQNYRGALYLGPRIVLGETQRVLEIHILDFDQEIYGQTIAFQLGPFIRPPRDFPNLEALKKQFQKDTRAVHQLAFSMPTAH